MICGVSVCLVSIALPPSLSSDGVNSRVARSGAFLIGLLLQARAGFLDRQVQP